MAVRSASNTGLIVALIVFIILTIGMLAMTIIFYTAQTTAEEEKAEAENTLAAYATREERNRDAFAAVRNEAEHRRMSVYGYQQQQLQNLAEFLTGDPRRNIEQLRSEFTRFNVPEDGPVLGRVREMNRELQQRSDDINALNNQIAQRDEEISELEGRLEQQRQAHQQEIQELRGSIDGYREQNEEMYEDIRLTKDQMRQSLARQTEEFEEERTELENQIDEMRQENFVVKDRLGELESVLSDIRVRAQDPSQLAAGRVIDVAGDEVFINRGSRDRIVLGMTFEIFSSESSIAQVDPRSGQLQRGKASIEVIRVGDRTSTAKVVRSRPGQPVAPDDVIANAIYDPDYRFKFLVHGRFDVDRDGRATTEERDYIKSQIVDWGGEIVEGEEIPGDLDFLVLGMQPPEPAPLPSTYSDRQLGQYIEQQEILETYNRLQRQAREAQIPVLNANRFFILTGTTSR